MNSSRRSFSIGITLVAATLIGVGYSYVLLTAPPKLDNRMLSALKAVQALGSYEMAVETRTRFSDRDMTVSGTYLLDLRNERYASLATTTLQIPNARGRIESHSFTLENISIGDDVYLRIDTESPLLRESIPYSAEWRQFTGGTIPAEFTDIAVHGPVLNNLALFSGNGKYLRLLEKPQEFVIEGVRLFRYRFELSDTASDVSGGTLRSLLNRIGRGSVDVWLDETPAVRVMTVHGENYVSTTTVIGVNTPLQISAPAIVR